MNIRFDGKLVVVSGAARGFGLHLARRFAGLGAIVHGCDLSAEVSVLSGFGAHPRVLDLTDRQAVAAWIGGIERKKPIEVLVNNAGGIRGAVKTPLDEVSDAEWHRVMDSNAGATFVLSGAVVPAMRQRRRGAIVNMSSGAGIRASPVGIHAYTAAKHAVVGLTRQMASELGPYGITVNSVAPGFVPSTAETERDWIGRGPEGQAATIAGTAMRRLGTIEDICDAVLFLASDRATWITGQVLAVDGGR